MLADVLHVCACLQHQSARTIATTFLFFDLYLVGYQCERFKAHAANPKTLFYVLMLYGKINLN